MKDSLLLLSHFLKNPREVGSIAPSSKFLTNGIISSIDFKKSKIIIELGPGVGTFTKCILKKADPKARLFCFEVNKKFCEYMSKNITDERLMVINAPAQDLTSNSKKFGIKKADCIISGLPFLNFPDKKRRKILDEIKNALSDNGRFILFQYTSGLINLLEEYFSKVEKKFIPLNMPPSFVYVCEK